RRLELIHGSLLQSHAEAHVEAIGWRAWVADPFAIRGGFRSGLYIDRHPGGFQQRIETALVSATVVPRRDLTLRGGVDESVIRDRTQTTLRLAGAFDDGRATTATVDLAARELLTNPVAAVSRRGATDRLTAAGR